MAIIINTRKSPSTGGKVGGTTGETTCVHTVRAEDLRIMRPIPGQGGLSLVLKLEG